MEMIIEFPGGSRVDAHFGPFTVHTDQFPDLSAPSPFALFLASIGTCAGYYVQEFCHQREISSDGLRIKQSTHSGPTGLVTGVDLKIELPSGFPEKYRESIIRAAELCTVKKHLEDPPAITVTIASVADAVATDTVGVGAANHNTQGGPMSSIKMSTRAAIARGRDAAVRVGKVAKSAVVAGAKAGAVTALEVGTLEAEKRWRETSPAVEKKRTRKRVMAAVAGAAVLGAAGMAIASSRRTNKK
jgi:ribosomal protein S12 methylthiotransferase accessory factor